MSLTTTSLSAAITAGQTKQIPVTSTAAGFPAVGVLGTRQLIQVDGEYMLLDQVLASGVINVLMRGYNGTTAVAHDALAPLNTSANAQDFGNVPVGAVDDRPPYVDDVVSVGQNGVIPVPVKNTTVLLTKGSALATTTLGAPSKAKDGIRLTITSETAFAHVITATSLIADGVSGSPHSTLTFGAFIGASIVLESANGLWNVVSQVVCVVS